MKEHTDLFEASDWVGLSVNTDETEYVLICRQQNAIEVRIIFMVTLRAD
jgi:hypothetical protein